MNPKTIKSTNLNADLLSCGTITVNGQTLDGTVSDVVANYGTSTSGSTIINGHVYSNTLEVATLAKQFYLKTPLISPKTGTTITISGNFGTSVTPYKVSSRTLSLSSSDAFITLQNTNYTSTQLNPLIRFFISNLQSNSYIYIGLGKSLQSSSLLAFQWSSNPFLTISKIEIYKTYVNINYSSSGPKLRINDIPFLGPTSTTGSISNSSSSPSSISIPTETNFIEIQLNNLVANRSTTASSPIVSLQLSDTSTFPNTTWKYYGSGQASYFTYGGTDKIFYPDKNGNNVGLPIFQRDANNGTTFNANGILTLTKHSEDGVEKGWHAYIRMYCADSNDRWFFVGYVENPSTKILSRIKINLYQWNSPTVYTLTNLNYKITFY